MRSRQIDPNLGRAGKVRPSLEGLEDRTCPTAAVSIHGTALVIAGTATDNAIVITDQGNGDINASIANSQGAVISSVSAKGVQSITVNSIKGDEKVAYSLTGTLKTTETLNVALGGGQNTVKLNYAKGITNANLNVNVQTSTGYDVVDAVFGAMANSNVKVNMQLGNDLGQAHVEVDGAITGKSVFDVLEHGSTGFNGLNFEMNGTIASTASVTANLLGGSNSDTLETSYHGILDGSLTITEKGGNGGNWIESDVGVSSTSTGKLVDELTAGQGGDLLILQLQNTSKLKSAIASTTGTSGQDEGIVSKGVTVKGISLT